MSAGEWTQTTTLSDAVEGAVPAGFVEEVECGGEEGAYAGLDGGVVFDGAIA